MLPQMDCALRAKTKLGSSTMWPTKRVPTKDILKTNTTVNPDFSVLSIFLCLIAVATFGSGKRPTRSTLLVKRMEPLSNGKATFKDI